jgi:uncharacterized membrane protein
MDATQHYLQAKGRNLAESLGDRFGGVGQVLREVEEGGASPGEAIAKVGVGKVGEKVKQTGEKVKDAVTGGLGKSKSGPKVINIVEEIDVGVPARTAYDQWTQFQEFNRFMKGVEGVDQKDETTTNWRAKVGLSRRTWESQITEQIPDKRIAWTSEGAKGTVNGVVTFHELAEDLTKVLLVLEYHPKGLFEHTGNLFRAQGRRARLDLKHFRRFIMTEGEATGSWRGEIHDGEVTDSGEGDQKQGRDRKQGRGGQRSSGERGERTRRRPAGQQSDGETSPRRRSSARESGSTPRRRATSGRR